MRRRRRVRGAEHDACAAGRGERLWRVPLDGARAGAPQPLLDGRFVRVTVPPSARLGLMSATASRPKVRPLDPLGLDELLSDEDRLIAETVRRFATDRVLRRSRGGRGRHAAHARLAPAIGELGGSERLSGYGCAGRAVGLRRRCRELEAADSGLRSFVSVQGSLAMSRSGSSVRRAEGALAPGHGVGELIGCSA